VRPHSSTAANEATRQLKFELLPNLPCIPDLTLFNYHMFEPLKKHCINKDLAVIMKLRMWQISGFNQNQKTFFAVGTRRFVNHYTI